MKERPILFSAPMVRAILDGSKTQTRRVVKLPRGHVWGEDYSGQIVVNTHGYFHGREFPVDELRCPYGRPGDWLWVRETWVETDRHDGTPVVAYRACGCIGVGRTQRDGPDHLIRAFAWDDAPEGGIRWRASIHMPRWASRILLEITDVRVERLQDISRGDAMGEGCPFANMAAGPDPREWFADLWRQINGADSWDANPWVWVIEFKRVEPPTP